MSLRIAVDLDGTLADMNAALQAEAERMFGPGVDLLATLRGRAEAVDPAAPAPGGDGRAPMVAMPTAARLSDRQLRQIWSRVAEIENFWTSLREIEPGAVARLAHAAAAFRWDVLFITTRPPSGGDPTQRQSQAWLEAHGFPHPSVFVVYGSRGQIASALSLDAVLDDRPENCVDIATDSKARSILIWRDTPELAPPGAQRLGIDVVFSIAEAVELLRTPANEPSFVERLKGILGA